MLDWPGCPAAAVTTCECVDGPDKRDMNNVVRWSIPAQTVDLAP